VNKQEVSEIKKLVADKKDDLNYSNINSTLGIKRYIKMADQIKAVMGNGKILDWGCGLGQMSYLLKKRGLEVVSLDISSTKHPLLEEAGQAKVVPSNSVELPFPPASFDAVLSSGVLEHVDDPQGSLKEITRILKNQGYFFIYMLPNKYSYIEFISDLLRRGAHPIKYSVGGIKKTLKQLNFEVLTAGYQNFLPYNLKGFPSICRKIYLKLSGAIATLDLIFTHVPLLNKLSTNIIIIAKKESEEQGR